MKNTEHILNTPVRTAEPPPSDYGELDAPEEMEKYEEKYETSSILQVRARVYCKAQSTNIYKYRVPGVIGTIDPHPLSTHRVCPPPPPVHTRRAVRGWGVNI
jgi:hypothetical protein